MIVERLGRGALTTKADYFQFNDWFTPKVINSGQWSIENNQIISYSGYYDSRTLRDDLEVRFNQVIWNGTNNNNDELEYGVIFREYNNGSPVDVTESEFVSSGTPIQAYSVWQNNETSINQFFAFKIFVRRKDGGILTPSDMEASIINLYAVTRSYIVQTTAIPQNWLETTTATFQNPMDTYTTVIPTDYDISSSQYDPLLEIPSKIDTAINFVILGFGRIMNFKYITFVICFVLIVGLVAWLLH